jgi:PAS domain S-box-containing protein
MKTEARRPRAAYYIGAVALVIVVLAASWVEVGTATRRAYIQFNARERSLEASIAMSAMAESFSVTINQSSIIATFSFSEYFQGKRSDESMRQLLAQQRRQLSGMIIDIYLDAPKSVRFISEDAGTEVAREALIENSADAWQAVGRNAGPYVTASHERGTFFIYYHPVRKDGALMGLLGAAIDLEPALGKYLLPLEKRPGRRAVLLGEDKKVLWSSKAEEIGSLLDEVKWSANLSSEEPFRLGQYTFRVVTADDESSLRAALLPAERLRDLVFVVGLALVMAAMGAATRLYSSESRRKAHAAAELRLEEAVRTRERELAISELRYRALFEAASDAILIVGADGMIHSCNSRALSMFARPLEGLVGKKPEEIASPRQADGSPSGVAVAALRARAVASAPTPIFFEWLCRRPDGTEFIAEASMAIAESGGTKLAQVILRDATERRQQLRLLQESLDEREVILRELHHRVKNNLQFIESLIELQRGSAGSEANAALAETQGRVAALSAAYLAVADRPETLIIEAPAYLRTICDLAQNAAYAAGTKLDIALRCEDIPIGLDAAISIGLILRELMDNSTRHGYGRGIAGVAEVSFERAQGEKDEGKIMLSIRDFGTGLPEGWKEGLGLSIVRALTDQLSGTLELREAKPGLSAVLLFPSS